MTATSAERRSAALSALRSLANRVGQSGDGELVYLTYRMDKPPVLAFEFPHGKRSPRREEVRLIAQGVAANGEVVTRTDRDGKLGAEIFEFELTTSEVAEVRS